MSLPSIESGVKSSKLPSFLISAFSLMFLVKFSAKLKKSLFLATKSVSQLILQTENELRLS
jgi:hypothetical protein